MIISFLFILASFKCLCFIFYLTFKKIEAQIKEKAYESLGSIIINLELFFVQNDQNKAFSNKNFNQRNLMPLLITIIVLELEYQETIPN